MILIRVIKIVKSDRLQIIYKLYTTYNKEDSVISVQNNMKIIKLFLKQLKFLFVLHCF